jgi:hypothetical protein
MSKAIPTDPVSAIALATGQVAQASTMFGSQRRLKLEGENVKSAQREQLKNTIFAERLSGSKDKTMTYVLIGVGVVALVGVAIYFSRKK